MINIKLSITTPLNNVIKFKTTQQQLSTCEYFRSLFGDVDEQNNTKINIDLSNFKYFEIDSYVNIFFNYINDPISQNEPEFNYDIYILIELCSYFGNEHMLGLIDETMCDYYHNLQGYDNKIQHKEFIENANFIYLIFHEMNKMEQFYELAEIVNTCEIDCGVKIDINKIILYQCYDLMKYMPNKCIMPKSFKLFEYQKLLEYSISPWPKYDNSYLPLKNNFGTNTIISENEFNNKFNDYTNNIFVGIDWSNMVIAGGFVFGLLNNISNSIIGSTDIDIFIYSTDIDIRKQKWEYLLEYFSKYTPVYINNKGIINIIIPTLNYDIQLIVFHSDNPESIINEFDLNYVRLYYDGLTVFANIGCLIGFKYQIADINIDYTKDLDKRICKTILKGLNIRKNDVITKHCKLVVDNIIDINKYDITTFNTQNIIRQSENMICEINNLYPTVELVTLNYKEIEWINVCDMFVTYKSNMMDNHILLTLQNIDGLQNLNNTQILINSYAVHNHIFNNIITNIYINIGYDSFTFLDAGEYDKNNATITLDPNVATKKLLQCYSHKIGNFKLKQNTEISRSISKKMKEIKIKLSIFDINEAHFIEKIKMYYDNIGLNYGEMCLNNQMEIVCNMEHLIVSNGNRTGKTIFKLNLSKLTFK